MRKAQLAREAEEQAARVAAKLREAEVQKWREVWTSPQPQ